MSNLDKPQKGPWGSRDAPHSEKSFRDRFLERREHEFARLKAGPAIEDDAAAMVAYASYFADFPFAERHEHFDVNDDGSLYFDLEDEEISLAAFARPTGSHGLCTADDLRRAAVLFQSIYPEMEFSFDEDRKNGRFSYTAKIRDA